MISIVTSPPSLAPGTKAGGMKRFFTSVVLQGIGDVDGYVFRYTKKNDLDEIRTHIIELRIDILSDYVELICHNTVSKRCQMVASAFKITIPNAIFRHLNINKFEKHVVFCVTRYNCRMGYMSSVFSESKKQFEVGTVSEQILKRTDKNRKQLFQLL